MSPPISLNRGSSAPIVSGFGSSRIMRLPFAQFRQWRERVVAAQAIDRLIISPPVLPPSPPPPPPPAQPQSSQLPARRELQHCERQFDFLPSALQPLHADLLECAICCDFVHLPDGAVQHLHVLLASANSKPTRENGWRSECGRIMCGVCVSQLRARDPHNAKCPSCRAPLDTAKPWQVTQLSPVPLHTRLALQQLAVQCKRCAHLDVAGEFAKHSKLCYSAAAAAATATAEPQRAALQPTQPASPNSRVQVSNAA